MNHHFRTAEQLPALTNAELPADWKTRPVDKPLGPLTITAGGATFDLRRPHGGALGRCQVCETTVVGLGPAGDIGGYDEFGNAAHRVCAFNLVAYR